MAIDQKFKIFAVNLSTGDFFNEDHGFFMDAGSMGILPFLRGYKIKCQDMDCGKDHLQSIDLLTDSITLFQKKIVPPGVLTIDRKYRVLAVSLKTGRIRDDKSGLFFRAADKAVLFALKEVLIDRDRRWPGLELPGKIESLIDRVETYQATECSKIPDTILKRQEDRNFAAIAHSS